MSKRPYKSNYKTDEDTNLNQAIGKKIKEARKNRTVMIQSHVPKYKGKDFKAYEIVDKLKPCTQTELAKAIGVTFQQIQKYEKGFNGLSSIKLLKISKFFNKPLEYFTSDATDLLGQNNPPDKNPNAALAPSNVAGLN